MISILSVCSANVCRSRLAEGLFHERFGSAGGTHRTEAAGPVFRSAGTVAVAGQPMCAQVETQLGSRASLVVDRTSRRMNSGIVGNSELLLFATLRQRSAAALLEPMARHRSFTYVEASRYLEFLTKNRDVDPALNGSEPVRLPQLVSLMNSVRANQWDTVVAPPHRRLFRSRSDSMQPLDIPDGHSESPRKHVRTLSQVTETILAICTSLESLNVDWSLPASIDGFRDLTD